MNANDVMLTERATAYTGARPRTMCPMLLILPFDYSLVVQALP